MAIELRSTAFQHGQSMPQKYTADGSNSSPPLKWGAPPSGARSLALLCEDPDAPRGTFTHWVVFNLPADARDLSEGIPAEATLPNGAIQGANDFGKVGYGGPSPPPGKPHRYVFKLYALDAPLDLEPGASKENVLKASKDHVLDEAELMGTYGR